MKAGALKSTATTTTAMTTCHQKTRSPIAWSKKTTRWKRSAAQCRLASLRISRSMTPTRSQLSRQPSPHAKVKSRTRSAISSISSKLVKRKKSPRLMFYSRKSSSNSSSAHGFHRSCCLKNRVKRTATTTRSRTARSRLT